MPRTALFLYTEAAPYVIACLEELARRDGVEVYMVRWPVNDEAPFAFSGSPIKMSLRHEYTVQELVNYVDRLAPDLIVTSGWVDKGYLKVCRKQRRRGIPIVMINDTAWRGDRKQQIAVMLAPFWIGRTFTHAWVTGTLQAEYARRLGFGLDRIRTGFYSADTSAFLPLGRSRIGNGSTNWPHRFLCVARYIPTKGHQYLCDAFADICDAGSAGDWELWIAGTGELHGQVTNSPSGSHPRIKHLGFKQGMELQKVMAECGVFVLPSIFEPWGVVVHEHACAAFPLLLSDAVGAAERFLRSGGNGKSFPAADRTALKQAMLQMIGTPDVELRSMGVKSMELAQQWDPKAWANTAMELMQIKG